MPKKGRLQREAAAAAKAITTDTEAIADVHRHTQRDYVV
jgi:hypothetical protein